MTNLDTHTLCGDDYDQKIMIQILKWQQSGTHKVLTRGYFTLNDLKK